MDKIIRNKFCVVMAATKGISSLFIEKRKGRLIKFVPVAFTPNEISLFLGLNGKNYSLGVATDVTNFLSALFVNLNIINQFITLHMNYWSKGVVSKNQAAIEQIKLLEKLREKLRVIIGLATKHELLVLNVMCDLRNMLRIIRISKTENLQIARMNHNEFNTMEIEKVMLELAPQDLINDCYMETYLIDIIIFSKYMASKLYGLNIP